VRDHFAELGRRAEVLVISFSRPDALEGYRQRLELPFPVAADPERRAYQSYGLERGSRWYVWHPRTLLRYLALTFGGMKLQRPRPDDDLSQLGGDFIVDGEGTLRFVHRSRRPDDRPGIDALLQALRP
jgi:hypothetical protein